MFESKHGKLVTILILIDGFLQYSLSLQDFNCKDSHNPYFNRWFSAMRIVTIFTVKIRRHNPYFNRWFSAIINNNVEVIAKKKSQSLF